MKTVGIVILKCCGSDRSIGTLSERRNIQGDRDIHKAETKKPHTPLPLKRRTGRETKADTDRNGGRGREQKI